MSKFNAIRSRSGFSLVEMMIAITLLLGLMSLVYGSSSFSRGDLQERASYTKIRMDAAEAHRYSIVGRVGSSTPWTKRDQRDYIPEDYGIVFRAGPLNPENSKYYLINSQNRSSAGVDYMRIIHREGKAYIGPNAYLGKIILKKNESDPGTSVQSVAMLYKNPLGRMAIYPQNQNFYSDGPAVVQVNQASVLNEFPVPNDSDYQIVQLDVYVNGGTYAYTLELNRNLEGTVIYKN